MGSGNVEGEYNGEEANLRRFLWPLKDLEIFFIDFSQERHKNTIKREENADFYICILAPIDHSFSA